MIILFSLISISYVALIGSFVYGFEKVNSPKLNQVIPKTSFSIIVPFRNEEQNLPQLLKSISNLNYPSYLFEVILVNDESFDQSEKIIEKFRKENLQLNIEFTNSIRKSNSPKKNALETAISISKFNWIITTDADCSVPKNWLRLFNQLISKNSVAMIAAPVDFITEKSFLHHFQKLNLHSLIGSTIGAFGIKCPFLCNGANLCYNKELFFKVKGFDGNNSISSGDDIFLLEKFQSKYPEKIYYLKSIESTVKTTSEKSWKNFTNQQLRWASKSTSYNHLFSKIVSLIILLENLSLIILLGISIMDSNYWKCLVFFFIIKSTIDFILLNKTATFFDSKNSIPLLIITSLIYPFYIVSIGFGSLFIPFKWKGRTFNK